MVPTFKGVDVHLHLQILVCSFEKSCSLTVLNMFFTDVCRTRILEEVLAVYS